MSSEELIYGWHSVTAALKYEPASVQALWVERTRNDDRMRFLLETATANRIPVREESRSSLDRMTGGARHQGVVAKSKGLTTYTEDDLPRILEEAVATGVPPLLLVLDQVQDPHNLGACLRSAEAAGVTAVIVPADRSVGLTATVRKVACGAAESVTFVTVTNLARALRELKELGVWVIGAAGEAETMLYEVDFKGPTAIVIGSEEVGMRRLVRETCDAVAQIPMAGSVESLNVSVATGVFLFEAVRQRLIVEP